MKDIAWPRTIGILGGLGPHAHLAFESLLLQEAARSAGRALADQEYPPWVLSSIPQTPSRVQAVVEGTDAPAAMLLQSAARLGDAVDFLCVPCNQAHLFLSCMRERLGVPLLDMVDETVHEVGRRLAPGETVGILGATGTLTSRLYRNRLARAYPRLRAITLLDLPDGERLQEELVMEPIFGKELHGQRLGGGIKSGMYYPRYRRRLLLAAEHLKRRDARLVVTACSEIPLALGPRPGDHFVDPVAALAREAIRIASGERPLPG